MRCFRKGLTGRCEHKENARELMLPQGTEGIRVGMASLLSKRKGIKEARVGRKIKIKDIESLPFINLPFPPPPPPKAVLN